MSMDMSDDAMDVSNDSNSGRFIPPELCACIIESGLLIQTDLHTLASVSRPFRQEAERYLYKCPTLLNKAKIKGFCTTVLRRPHLAERIIRLIIYMPPQTDFQVADLSRITKTLHLAVNLKCLDIFRESDRLHPLVCPGKGDALQTWILEGHAFKLKVLSNTYFDLAELQPFIQTQPNLEMLFLFCDGQVNLQSVPLTRLKHLSCPVSVFQEMYTGGVGFRRNIEVLFLTSVSNSSLEADIMMVQNLSILRSTLLRLRITKHMCGEGLTILNLVNGASQMSLFALRLLEILDFSWKDTYSNSLFTISLHHPFPQLRCLRLRPPFKRPDNPSVAATDSFYIELNTEVGRLAAATRILEMIPTLQWLALITPRYEYVYDRTRGGDGPPVKLMKARGIGEMNHL